jgi:hypothetical protein
MFDDKDPLLKRVRKLALAFPDAAEKVSHGRPAFYTTKVFAYYGGSTKENGVWESHDQALMVPADLGEREALLERDDAFYPAYLGPSGWVGIDLGRKTDWEEIVELLDDAYRRTAGKRRVAALDAQASGRRSPSS